MTSLDTILAWLPVAVLFSAAISVAVLWSITRLGRNGASRRPAEAGNRSTFLLRDGQIIDQSDGAKDLSSWHDLRAWLGDRFNTLPDDLKDTPREAAQVFHAATAGDCATVTIQCSPHGQSVTLEDDTVGSATDRHRLLVENRHFKTHQHALERAPAIVFAVDASGVFQWGNAKFDGLAIEDRKVFLKVVRERSEDIGLRAILDDPMSKRQHHFELFVLPGENHTVVYATDITRVVEADSVRNDFVQTLTKTFADLSTGLAVFDRYHRLVLFNPAILDLTDLSPEFLTARPHMMEFFDRLRDNHMLPEPKNYSTWRRQITDMINSAANGHYSESWSLPGGLTYKLTGRPHPNGAIAFLIEDITDEMALTRQSRSQLETHQAILDAIQEAIAVVGPDGGLVVCNAAFVEIFGFDPDASFARTSLKDVMQACRDRFPGAPVWDDLVNGETITPVDTLLRDGSGATTNFRIEPLPEGLFMLNLSRPMPAVPLSA